MRLPLPQGKRGKRIGIAVAIAAVIAVYYLISRLIPHEDLQKVLEDVSNTLGGWTYLLVGTLAFLETQEMKTWVTAALDGK